MPGELAWLWAQCCLWSDGELAVVEIGEREVAAAGEDGFGDVGFGDLDAPVVVEGREVRI